MNTLKKLLIISILFSATLVAQTVYELPLNSEGNIIQLSVLNSSDIESPDIRVAAIEYSEWIKFNDTWQIIKLLGVNERSAVSFSFNVDAAAPLNVEEKIKFIVSSNEGEMWEKVINIEVGLPKEFTLDQNYPNPFNPETTVSYQLPEDSKVTIKIFDILGKEVQTLVSEQQAAGIYKQNGMRQILQADCIFTN